jgi:hypothetical protein
MWGMQMVEKKLPNGQCARGMNQRFPYNYT